MLHGHHATKQGGVGRGGQYALALTSEGDKPEIVAVPVKNLAERALQVTFCVVS